MVAEAMATAGSASFTVFDGQNTYTGDDNERNRSKQVGLSEILKTSRTAVKDTAEGDVLQGVIRRNANDRQKANNRHHRTWYILYTLLEVVFEMGQLQHRQVLGCSGDGHPLNSSITLTADHTHTNNTE